MVGYSPPPRERTGGDDWVEFLSQRKYQAHTCNLVLSDASGLAQYLDSEEHHRNLEKIKSLPSVVFQEYLGGAIGSTLGMLAKSINQFAAPAIGSVLGRYLAKEFKEMQIETETLNFFNNLYLILFESSTMYLTVAASNSKDEAIKIALEKFKKFNLGFNCDPILFTKPNLFEMIFDQHHYSNSDRIGLILSTQIGNPFDYQGAFFSKKNPKYNHLDIPEVKCSYGLPSGAINGMVDINAHVPKGYNDADKAILKEMLSTWPGISQTTFY